MNFRNWTKQHTLGLLLGIATTIVFIPIIMFVLGSIDNISFSRMWFKFSLIHAEKTRIVSLASIANLIWFHSFLKKENFSYGQGVIFATILNLLFILYYKFIA